jgi:hypothetical protein
LKKTEKSGEKDKDKEKKPETNVSAFLRRASLLTNFQMK